MADSLGDLINSAAATNGVSTDWMVSILNVENPNLNPNAMSQTGVQGLSQITRATWDTVNPGVPYSLDPAAQLNTQAKLLAQYQSAYGGNFALAAAAYNGGPGVANYAQTLINGGMSQTDAINLASAQVYGEGSAKQNEINNYVAKATGQSAASLSAANKATAVGVDDSDPAAAVPVSGMMIPPDQIAAIMTAISPPLIIDTGLGQPGPLADNSILQVNNPTAPVGYPVSFQIYFDAGHRLPVVINLNASIRSHQKSLRHVITRQRTQTGMLVNIWGMHPDQIAGQASTGLMANQLGVTDFLSLSTVPSNVQQMVQAAFTQNPEAGAEIEAEMGASEGFLRIAAKDAFVELLSLFKNNGTVWFQNQNYTGYTTGKEQQAVDVWSPQTGSTTFQNAARRNDVMTRGAVKMNFRNAAYYGYFKNLSWVMDAKNPFRWNFNFVFQVESTVANVSLPSQ